MIKKTPSPVNKRENEKRKKKLKPPILAMQSIHPIQRSAHTKEKREKKRERPKKTGRATRIQKGKTKKKKKKREVKKER